MKKRLFIFIISITQMLIFSPSISFAEADRIFRENNKAVVVVVAYDRAGNAISQGSGFIIRADGAVVTNYHVISNASDIKIKAGSKVLKVKGFLHIDKGNDIVILKADGKGLPIVKIGDIARVNIGEKVYVIGSPQGLENTISDGILSGIREITQEWKVLQITAPISPGSSGGPVFNKKGEVIGVATFFIKEAQNLNFAMPVDVIKDKLQAKKITVLKDSALEDYKKTVEYWFYLGVAYGDAGMYKEAIDAYKQAIRIKPDDAKAHNNLGVAYAESGMYKEAIEAYKQAIRIKPDDAKAHDNLGNAYAESGMHKEAIEAYKQAIRIKPDDAVAHYNLGVAYGKAGKYEEEIEAYKQAIRIKPDYAVAHYNLGVSYLASGDRGMALEEYKILKDLDPQRANKLFNLIYK